MPSKEEDGKQGQRSEKEADHSRGWQGVGLGGQGTGQMSGVPWLYELSLSMGPTRGATPAQDMPACHNDDILSDAGHLLDGQVAHSAECGLEKTWRRPYQSCSAGEDPTQEESDCVEGSVLPPATLSQASQGVTSADMQIGVLTSLD